MKPEQQQQAQRLYFQSDLTKTEIAESVGISRRSLHYWIRQNNWEQLRKNAAVMPSFLAENCYQVLGGITTHLLSANRIGHPATPAEVNSIYKLTMAITKLKNSCTLNESMEVLGQFTDALNDKDPMLAAQVQPHMEEYIKGRAAKGNRQYRESGIASAKQHTPADSGVMDEEQRLDIEDFAAWSVRESGLAPNGQKASSNAPVPESPQKPPQKSIRDMLRGTATTGPSKALKQNPPKAA